MGVADGIVATSTVTFDGNGDGVIDSSAVLPASQTFGGLDVIDGGAGVDTLRLTNELGTMTLATSVKVSNVENLELRSAQNPITADVQEWTGLKSVNVDQRGGSNVINVDTKANVESITITAGSAAAPAGVITLRDQNTTAGADKLATVSVTGAKGAVNISSDALTNLTLADSAVVTTVTNTTVGHTLNVTANKQSGAAGVADAAATTVNVTASGANSSAFAVNAGVATAINFAGDKNMTATLGAQATGLKITSTGTGTLTIGTALSNDVTFTGGAGKEIVTLSNANTKAIAMGAGDDTVNVTGTTLGTGGTIDGGDGVDTIAMSAADAAALSALTPAETYEARISNFEKVGLGQVAGGANNTVNLANLDDISYVVSAGTAAGTGAPETAAFTFEGLKSGQVVTFAGLTVTATDDLSATQVAQAFAGATVAGATVGGTLDTEYDTTAPSLSGATVTIVREVNGNDVSNVTASYATAAGAAPTAPTATLVTNGANAITAVREVATLTLTSALVANTETVIIGDGAVSFTYTAGADVGSTGGALAAAVVAAANGTAAFAARYTAAASGDNVVFTEVAPGTDSPDLALTGTGLTAADTYTFAVTTQGVTGAAAVAEIADVTFSALKSGQSATIGGRTITALDDIDAATVADTFFGGVNTAVAQVSGTLSGYTLINTAAGDAVVRFTNATAGDATLITGTAAVAALPTVDAGELVIVDGNSTSGGGALTLTNMANAGTVELTGNNGGTTTVTMKDATGSADSLNLKLNDTANLAAGAVTVAGVETINITATDSLSDTTTVQNPTAASTLQLNAAAATTITVTGNHGVDFSGSSLAKVTTLDASGVAGNVNTTGKTAAQIIAANGVAGAVTFTTAVTDKAVTITTGNGNDVIVASTVGTATGVTAAATISTGAGRDTITGGADADVIDAGSERDTVNSSTGADTITLGAGNDVYVLQNATHSVLASFDTITDFSANTYGQGTSGAVNAKGADTTEANLTGDTIKVSGLFSGSVVGIKVLVVGNAADAQTFIQNTGADATNYTGFALDTSSNQLYMDFNQDGTIDSVIKLTGVTTITEAAFVTGL